MAEESCTTCCADYTTQLRKQLHCPYCEYKSCASCVKRYLLSVTADAHCMSCRKEWNDDFLDMNFTKAFRTGAYKKHREDILVDREISILPTRQPRVEATINMRKHTEVIKELSAELDRLESTRKKILVKYTQERTQVIRYSAEAQGHEPPAWTLRAGEAKAERAKFIMKCPSEECRGFLSTAYKCGTCQMWACPDCLVIKGEEKDVEHTCDPGQKESVALIIKESRGCPKCGQRISKIDGCFAANTEVLLWNGHTKMSQDIVVGDELVGDDGLIRIVEETCTGEDEMYEVTQGRGMSYTVNSKHTLILTSADWKIEEIRVDDYMNLAESEKIILYGCKIRGKNLAGLVDMTSIQVKPIGRGVYYGWNVGGNHRFALKDLTCQRNCDQMWCTDCHTAFSWTTGQIVNGVVHNPHYYEFLRKQGNGVAPRNLGDVPCGGIPGYTRIYRLLPATSEHRITIMAIHRITSEIQDQRIRMYQGRFNVDDNGDLAVKYLMKEMSKDDMKAELVRRETKRNKHTAIRAVLEMFVNTSTILLNGLCDRESGPSVEEIQTLVDSYLTLRNYVNDALMNISRMKQCSVPQITPAWHWSSFNKVTPKTRTKATAAASASSVASAAAPTAAVVEE